MGYLNLTSRSHLLLCLQLQTQDYEPPFSPFHKSTMSQLNYAQDSLSLLYVYFPSSNDDCDGVFGSSSSSTKVLSFYSTSVSWFASYFLIGTSYLSSSLSFSFFGHFLCEAFTNEYQFTLFIPNRYFTWHNKWVSYFQFVGFVSHECSLGACCKMFTKFGLNISTLWHRLCTPTLYFLMPYIPL